MRTACLLGNSQRAEMICCSVGTRQLTRDASLHVHLPTEGVRAAADHVVYRRPPTADEG
jgi:hypothetical protein